MNPDSGPQALLIYRVSDVVCVLLMGMIGGAITRRRDYDIIGFFFIVVRPGFNGG